MGSELLNRHFDQSAVFFPGNTCHLLSPIGTGEEPSADTLFEWAVYYDNQARSGQYDLASTQRLFDHANEIFWLALSF